MSADEALKRLVDLIVATLLLLPICVFIAIAGLLIIAESPGPVLFRQTRVGRHGRLFRVYKLRTMIANAQRLGAGLYTDQNDQRFTKVGLVLRRLSVDELPQVFNILTGDMSLVGPRPLPPEVVALYPQEFERILAVKPGITGLAQVSGRNALGRRERLNLDIQYAARRSLVMDFGIMARTARAVLRSNDQRNYQSREDVER